MKILKIRKTNRDGNVSFSIVKEQLVNLEREDLCIHSYLIREGLILLAMQHSALIFDERLRMTKNIDYSNLERSINFATCFHSGFGANSLRFIISFGIKQGHIQETKNEFEGDNR